MRKELIYAILRKYVRGGIKDQTYTISNNDSTAYFIVASSHVKQDLGAKEILAATLGAWQGNITNKHVMSISYVESQDSLYILFEPHTFSNQDVTVKFLYR